MISLNIRTIFNGVVYQVPVYSVINTTCANWNSQRICSMGRGRPDMMTGRMSACPFAWLCTARKLGRFVSVELSCWTFSLNHHSNDAIRCLLARKTNYLITFIHKMVSIRFYRDW